MVKHDASPYVYGVRKALQVAWNLGDRYNCGVLAIQAYEC